MRACGLTALLAVLALAATPAHAAPPVYEITGTAANDAERLAKRLGLKGRPGARGLQFFSAQRFARIPRASAAQAATTFDLDALRNLRRAPAAATTRRFDRALRDIDLGPAEIRARATSGGVQAADVDGKLLADVKVDRRVSYDVRLSRLPVIGAGAKIGASYDAAGKLSQASLTLPELRRGASASVARAAQVNQQAQILFTGCTDAPMPELKARSVYYLPSRLEAPSARRVVPHTEFRASVKAGDATLPARSVLLPAVSDAPRPVITMEASGAVVRASVRVTGGRGPYRVRWTSCSTELDEAAARRPSIEYTVAPGGEPRDERLLATIIDADGLLGLARAQTRVSPPPPAMTPPRPRARASAGPDIGAHGLGSPYGLPETYYSIPNLQYEAAKRGVYFPYIKYDAGVQKNHFLPNGVYDPASGQTGASGSWIESVDLAFYTGHADGDNIQVANWPGRLSWKDRPVFGRGDLKWLVVAACGPLQWMSSGYTAIQRWGPRFDGLHALMGYATVSNASMIEGQLFGRYLLGTSGYSAMPVVDAWVRAAVESQPAGIQWAYLLPVSKNNQWNKPGYFPGRGLQTGDIPYSQISYFLRYYNWT